MLDDVSSWRWGATALAAALLWCSDAHAGGKEGGCCEVTCDAPGEGAGSNRDICVRTESFECDASDQKLLEACNRTRPGYTPEHDVNFIPECSPEARGCVELCEEDPFFPTESWTVRHNAKTKLLFLNTSINDQVLHSEGPCEDNEDCPCCTEGESEARTSITFEFDPPIGKGADFTFGGDIGSYSVWCAEAECRDTGPTWSCKEEDACVRDTESRTFKSSQRLSVALLDWALLKVSGSLTLAGSRTWERTEHQGDNTCGGCCASGVNPTIDVEANRLSLHGDGKAEIGWGWFKYTIDVQLARGCVKVETGRRGTCSSGDQTVDNRSLYLGIACGLAGSSEIQEVGSLCAEGAFFDACFKAKPADGGCMFGIGDANAC